MFWLYTAAVVAIIAAIPFIRFYLKRSVMAYRLKRACEKNGYSLVKTSKSGFLGNRGGRDSDFFIETQNEIFAVKLFASIRKNTKIIITRNRRYIIRKYYAFLSTRSLSLQFSDSKYNPFGEFDFHYPQSGKRVRKVLLVCPNPLEINYLPKHGSYKIIGNGDELFGLEFHTIDSFIKKAL